MAGFAYLGDDSGLIWGTEIDDGDVCVAADLCETRPLRLWPHVVLRKGLVVSYGGEKLIRHEMNRGSERELRDAAQIKGEDGPPRSRERIC